MNPNQIEEINQVNYFPNMAYEAESNNLQNSNIPSMSGAMLNYPGYYQMNSNSQSQGNNSILQVNNSFTDAQPKVGEPERPWMKASKDLSMIQKGSELFVGNLSIETTEEDLYQVFKECGEIIDIRVHKNMQTKKCYAFIRFINKEILKEALTRNMMTLKGRKIKVTKSNENSTIFIGNIRKNWSNADVETKVRRIFHNCEKIEHFPDPSNPSKNRGFCFVIFKNRNEAIKALNYVASKGGINIDGVPLTCDWADVVDDDESNSKQIFISGLDENIGEFEIREAFSAFGNVTDIVMSKNHKNSKRKDLAFVSFESHEEAKKAVEHFTSLKDTENPLGSAVAISLAFSQQAMQTKKKIKEGRKKVTQMVSVIPNTATPIVSHPIQAVPNMSVNPGAMLALVNLFNMNKTYSNISPTVLTQMMAACLGSMLNPNQGGQPSVIGKPVPGVNSMITTSNNNTSNPSSITVPVMYPQATNPLINMVPNNINNKRMKNLISKKRRNNNVNNPAILNTANPNSNSANLS